MRMKKSMLLIVLLVMMSSLMAAMSYSSATVTSAMTGSVTSTNTALLALHPGAHRAAEIQDGVLVIDFNKGGDGASFGLQRHSEYVWNELFTVTNNSENMVYAAIKTENNLPKGITVQVKSGTEPWTTINSLKGIDIAKLDIASASGSQHEVKVDVKVIVGPDADFGNFAPNLVISGEAIK
ncbi:hypothetical protein HNO89_000573 [Sporosarcina luteola]|nr:hypothetical protein [Sporosarcina luteola]